RGDAERVVPPGARVDVEQLRPAVARIDLELELDETVVADLAQEAAGLLLELGQLDRADVGARTPELEWVLPPALRDHARERLAAREERAVGVLALAAARDQLLDDHLARADEGSRALDQLAELLPAVGAPGLLLRLVDEVVLDRRPDRPGRLALDLVDGGNVL